LLEHLLGGHESLAGLSELIRARTGGNPFFIEEVVWSLVESGTLVGERGAYRLARPAAELEIPATVQSVLAARIDRLREREKQVLQTASVIGKRFSAPVLERVIEMPEFDLAASLSALLGAEFVYQEALYPRAEYAFKHPLTQEVVYGSQLSERRARTHGAVARAIAADEPEKLNECTALIAHHWEAAGELLEAARWSRRAAEWAGFSDPAEALRHWRGVRRLAAEAPESAEAAGLALAACVWILAFAWRVGISEDEAWAVFREGRRLAQASGDLHSLARLCSSYGFHKVLAMEPAEEALALLDEATGLAREVADSALTLRLAGEWTVSYRNLGRIREAFRISGEVIERARSDPSVGAGIGRLRGYGMLLCAKGMVLGDLARLEEAVRVGEEASRLARERGWDEILFWATACLARTAFAAGDAGRALHHARDAEELAERIGGSGVRANGFLALGMAHLAGRRWGKAKVAFERANATATSGTRNIYLEAMVFLAEATLEVGDPDGARAAIDEAMTLHRDRQLRTRINLLLTLARILLRTEGIRAADRIEGALSEAWRLSEEQGAPVLCPHVHVQRAELARLRGDGTARERELREAHRLFTEMGATGHAKRLAKELGL
jgi:adenylate cyclase